MGIKSIVRRIVTNDSLVPLWRPLARNLVAANILHRFADPELGVRGHSLAALRSSLAFLRRHRIHIATLGEVLTAKVARQSVIFTVDDGYADFARVAAPVFAEFDCPVTVFLVTGAVDGACWYWWDRIEFTMQTTKRTRVELDLFGRTVTWQWQTPEERAIATSSMADALKVMPNEQKELTLVTLAERLEVDVPVKPTPRYSAMSWSDVRRCAEQGVTFGPHTVTHPILPAVADRDAKWEILESWRRLRSECTATVPVFAYPSGVYSVREVSILAESGFTAAMTTQPRYTSSAAFRADDLKTRFTVPRFSYTSDRAQFVQVVTGVERLKLAVRGGEDVGGT